MTTIVIEPSQAAKDALPLVKAAIDSEIAHLELALSMARKRLLPFEEKYGVTSEQFISQMTAEDLTGKDNEYVQWAGEYRLLQRLEEKLNVLQSITYNDPDLLHAD